MHKKITKAIFPVAGLGTRFLPATKAIPKEMLPIVDQPAIQIVVDEAKDAGIEHLIFVTGRNKSVIEDHFDHQYELEAILSNRNKVEQLEVLEADLPKAGTISYTRQQQPLGLGHAVWCARHIVGNEPFALILPDMLIRSKIGCIAQMIKAYNKYGGNHVAVEQVETRMIDKYGVVAVGEEMGNSFEITDMIEKPNINEAPSNFIISGRYILQPEIFFILETQNPGAGNEIQLTDAMIQLLKTQDFYGLKFDGTTFDCGSKIGFLTANIVYGLARDDIRADFIKAIKELHIDGVE